tara:strand:+ start:4638 stop:6389 length:1752 start_codon:yes stop_codon:yes gene_type:complete
MQISIANAILVARLVGKSIVRRGLKMWLDFKKSNILGCELVVDGDFLLTGTQAASVTGDYWQTGSAWTIGSGSAHYDGTSNGSELRQFPVSPSLSAGTTLLLSFTISNVQAGKTAFFKIEVSGVPIIVFGYTNFNEGFHQFTYTLSGSQDRILIVPLTTGTGGTFSISDITTKQVAQFAPDESNNCNEAELYTGKALSFNGNDEVSDFGNPNINLKSICFWVNLSTTSEQIFNLTSTHNITASSGVITLGGTWSKSNIYVNAVDTATIGTTFTRVVITTDTNILVNDLEFARIGSDYGALSLADVQIYDAELSLADALIDYNNPNDLVFNKGGSIALSNLKGYWALSEGSGSITYDSSGQGNNGTITGATYDDQQTIIPQLGMVDWAKSTPVATEVTLIEAPNNVEFDILGNALRLREGGLNLDGTGYAQVADDASLDVTTAVTLECWVKWNTENSKGLIAKWGPAGDRSFLMQKVTNGVDFYLFSSSFLVASSDLVTGTGDWKHIACTYNGSTQTVYINGSVSGTPASNSGNIRVTTRDVEIGRYDSNNYYSDIIDEIRIYNISLTATEVLNNYKVGLPKHS